jgi:hypothetical protein
MSAGFRPRPRTWQMPKRIIDGERVWNSRKIAILKPEHRAEYSWIYPLALANGVFECSARNVFFTCYKNRPEVDLAKTQQILDDFAAVGLLFRWKEPDGSEWGYWTGAHAQYGVLPAESRVKDGHYTLGPKPPTDQFNVYVMKHHLRTNGHGPGSTLQEQATDEENRKQLAESVRKSKAKTSL